MNDYTIEKFETKVKYNKLILQKINKKTLQTLENNAYGTTNDLKKIIQELQIILYLCEKNPHIDSTIITEMLNQINDQIALSEIKKIKKTIALLDIYLDIECCFFTEISHITREDILEIYSLINKKEEYVRRVN